MEETKTQTVTEFFKQNKYIIVTDALSKDLASFIYNYFQNKRKVAEHLFKTDFLSSEDQSWGYWNDPQIPNTYSHYADLAMETISVRIVPIMKQVTGIDLLPSYTYARIYKYGDVLHRHKDRPSCEISCTINLGGDSWPIYLDATGDESKEGIKVDLTPGDMLVYKGCEVDHWREPFGGYEIGQVFCHYVDSEGPYAKEHHLDNKAMIGLPAVYRGVKK